MQHIFSFGLEAGKHAMGSCEPLSFPMPEFPNTQDTEAVLDGPDKPFEHVPVLGRKSKKGGLMEEDISVFTSMTKAVKEVGTAIWESKSIDVHPDLYTTVMDQGGFSQEALMAALSHLVDNKAHGIGFAAMADAHMVLRLRSWLGKHYY